MFPLYSSERWRIWLACTTTAFALGTVPIASAGIPATIAYQGHLTQTGGSPLTGTTTLQISLYTTASGGTALWSETHTNTNVSNGVFAVPLGSITPLTLPFDTPYYLGVTVNGGTELLPRQPLTSAPYALNALSANTVMDGAITASKLGENCAAGETLLRNVSGWACGLVPGTPGPAGPAGPAGAQGAVGATGPAGPAGAQGATGPAGSSGAAGANALVQLTTEPVGIHCAVGGTKVEAGSDADGNNTLDVNEVTVTRYVCNGAQGPVGTAGPAGAIGPQGPTGATGAAGPAGAAGSVGPAGPQGPIGATGLAGPIGPAGNAGSNALLKISTEVAGANCATGGVKVDAGNDSNANATLDAAEVVTTRYVCNGVQGIQGVQGATGPMGPAGPAGSGGGTTGLTTVVHGCFDGSLTSVNGTGYTVSRNGSNYTIGFTNAFNSTSYSLLVDARTSTGRSRAITSTGKTTNGTTWSAGWLDTIETQGSMCFVAAL